MDALQAGIAAARAGRKAEARSLLQRALQDNPRSQQGWLWMSSVVDTDEERRVCLEQVLVINPHNETARLGLEKLKSDNGRQKAVEHDLSAFPAPSPSESSGRVGDSSLSPSTMDDSWPRTSPTQAMTPVARPRRRIERLAPEFDSMDDDWAALRGNQARPQSAPSPESSSSERDPFLALVLIGGLSVTALGGALMLALLWLIGWPP